MEKSNNQDKYKYISLKYINNNFYGLIKKIQKLDYEMTFHALKKAYECFEKEVAQKLNSKV